MSFKEKYEALIQRMFKIAHTKRTVFFFVLAFILVFSFLAEPLYFMRSPCVNYNGEHTVFNAGENGQISTFEYLVEGNSYKVTGIDPQLGIKDLSHVVKYVVIEIEDIFSADVEIEVFYGNGSFSEKDKVKYTMSTLSHQALIEIPEGSYSDVRIDINQDFVLKSITVADGDIDCGTYISEPFSIVRVVTLFAILLTFVLVFLYYKNRKAHEHHLCASERVFVALCFLFYTTWTVLAPFDYAPDEAMRYDVTKFLFENNRLPVGSELLHPIWGFSYAHLPAVLCNIFGYVFMKFASVFTANKWVLLIAARMVSVVSSTLAVYFVIKIAKMLFATSAKWIMVFSFALIPQYCFIASYVNNDSLALLGIAMIVYAWLLGMKDNWTYSAACILVVGISICALSYYNSYAWILLSVFLFIISYFRKNPRNYSRFVKLASFIVVCTLIFVGYSFIRHLVLYGDLLGFETSHKYGELYAADGMRPSERLSLNERGVNLVTMLLGTDYNWVNITSRSFVGIFGYMEFPCPTIIYIIFALFIVIGVAGFVFKLLMWFIKRQKITCNCALFYICMIFCAIITVSLSIYNSFNTDFQPQGRYCYPALITLALVCAKGFEALIALLKKNENKRTLVVIVCTVIATASLMAFDSSYVASIM